MESIRILMFGILFSAAGGASTTPSPQTCTSTSCSPDQYCFQTSAVAATCRACDMACDGCTGFGPENCVSCNLGYQLINGICEICRENTFGTNCTGTCHCLPGTTPCDHKNGTCEGFQCEWGWQDPPYCQSPCSNDTFGAGCEFLCHCPPGDHCSPINGLCAGGVCETGWAGSSCQTWLARLEDPPLVENVTCGNATVLWTGWRAGVDDGDRNSVIRQYRLYSRTADGNWTLTQIVQHVAGQKTYSVDLVDLEADAYYQFRVDVNQTDLSSGKILQGAVDGEVSDFVLIPCTVSTTAPQTTPAIPATTTPFPQGPHDILDESKFNRSLQGDAVVLEWAVFENVTGLPLTVTVHYYIAAIGDCMMVEQPIIISSNVTMNGTTGNFSVSKLLPWRQYVFNITALLVDHGSRDGISWTISTREIAPNGNITNVTFSELTATMATITWVPLPCEDRGGNLLYYWLQFYDMTSDPMTLERNVTVKDNSYVIGNLVPYTHYGVGVTYVNTQGTSGRDWLVDFRTLEDVPGAPSITVSAYKTVLAVTLTPPSVTNGILTNYMVTRDTNPSFNRPQSLSQLVSDGNTINITNLSPHTTYYVKAQATTSVGPGNYSETVNVTTLEDVSGPPGAVTSDLGERNETCVTLSWTPPTNPQGVIQNYVVEYRRVSGINDQLVRATTNNTSIQICNLSSGAYYDFDVGAQNSAGTGAFSRSRFSTEQADPTPPPTPIVLKVTATTIDVAIDPVVLTTGPLTGYLVFVNDLGQRRKRAVSASNTTCPGENEVPGYIARNFTPSNILTRTTFIIGSAVQEGNYSNPALKDGHRYDIYYVLISYLEGICKYSFSKTASPVLARNPTPVTTTTTSSNTALIVGIVIGVILLLLIVVFVVLFVFFKRRQSNQLPYKPYVNEKHDMTVFRVDYDLQKYWNTIYSLRESRYIVAGQQFRPDSKQFQNGSVAVSNSSPPLTFSDEFHRLPHTPLASCNEAKKRDNTLKNRFNHLLPYDHSRVVLQADSQSPSTYINANFLHGHMRQHAYIAAQSPFDEETVLDFWRMIYQYEVKVIVMVSNIVEDNIVKCTQYWPEEGQVKYGGFILDLISVQEYADYFIRSINVRMKDDTEWQTVYLFDFRSWPEHGVPDTAIPMLEMRHKVRQYYNQDRSPILVHCGTGVSRTGVFIAIDSLLEQYQNDGRISAFSFVRKMRKDRIAMIRTVKQYVFVYEAIFEARIAGETLAGFDLKDQYHSLTKKNPATGHSFLKDQFKLLQLFTRKLYPPDCKSALVPANINKNRFAEVVPPDEHRPWLQTPGGLGRTDYINAVFLDSYRRVNHYIVTQTPLHTTVIDFWKLVYDFDVHTIVMMENFRNEDDTCAEYWPEGGLKQFEPFFIETTDIFQQENITIRNIKLVCMNSPHESRVVRQFQFNAWSDTEFVPKSKSMLLDMIDMVSNWQNVSNNGEAPIIVHCKDGATHSGLFCAVSILCEKFKDDEEVDVFHTVKHLKRRRAQIIDTLDQYRFCYKALWDYMNMRLPGGTLTDKMAGTYADRPYGSLSLGSYNSGYEQDYYSD